MAEETKKKKFKMLSSYSIVFIFLMVTAALSWFVPESVVVENNGTKQIVFDAIKGADGTILQGQGLQPKGLWDVIIAPAKGFAKAAPVGFAILMAGSFLHLMNYVGAMNAGIGWLLKRFTGKTLIVILMFVFAVFGSVYGLWEEIPAYSAVIVPLFVLAGYDVVTGIAVMTVSATAGNMASVINPFSVGAAVGAIGNEQLSLGSGIVLRMVLFIVLYAIGLVYVLHYAQGVKKDPSKSIVAGVEVNTMVKEGETEDTMDTRKALSMGLLVVIIGYLVAGYIPWDAIKLSNGSTMKEIVNMPATLLSKVPVLGELIGAGHFTSLGDWYFDEFSFVFLAGSIALGFINRMSEEEFVKEFLAGARELLGVVLVLTVANGISVVMGTKSEGMSVTFVYWIQNALSGVPGWAFAVAATMAYVGIGFFLQSTSGAAGITMPILGAVAYALFQSAPIGSIGGQVLLMSAFCVGLNFTSSFYPSATNMGTLELYKVPYDVYLKFILKIMIPMLIAACVILSFGHLIHLV